MLAPLTPTTRRDLRSAAVFGLLGALLYLWGDLAEMNYLSTFLMLGGILLGLPAVAFALSALTRVLVSGWRRRRARNRP